MKGSIRILQIVLKRLGEVSDSDASNLKVWDYNRTKLDLDDNVLATINTALKRVSWVRRNSIW